MVARWFRSATAVAVVAVAALNALANDGRYLPNTLAFNGVDNATYLPPGPAVEYDANVVANGDPLGAVHFTYDRWNGNDHNTGDVVGGGCLAGGFTQNSNILMKQDYTMRWVQIVSSTFSGQNEWGAPNGSWFPDTNNGRTDPSYPFQTLPVANGVGAAQPAVNPAFQDFPSRFPVDGNQTWRAELSLCAISLINNDVCIIGSFLWGFNVTQNPTGFPAVPPAAWVPGGSANLLNVLTDAFDGNGLTGGNPANSTSWTVGNNCTGYYTVVPAPAGLLTFAAGGLLVARRRRAAA